MRKQFRLGDKHPLHKKLNKIWDTFDKEKIALDFQRDGTILVMDRETSETYELKDLDDGGHVGHLPPVFDYKLTFEKEVKE